MKPQNTLIEGEPMTPDTADLIAQRIHLPIEARPPGDGWRVLSGNTRFNTWGRLAYRYEINMDFPQ